MALRPRRTLRPDSIKAAHAPSTVVGGGVGYAPSQVDWLVGVCTPSMPGGMALNRHPAAIARRGPSMGPLCRARAVPARFDPPGPQISRPSRRIRSAVPCRPRNADLSQQGCARVGPEANAAVGTGQIAGTGQASAAGPRMGRRRAGINRPGQARSPLHPAATDALRQRWAGPKWVTVGAGGGWSTRPLAHIVRAEPLPSTDHTGCGTLGPRSRRVMRESSQVPEPVGASVRFTGLAHDGPEAPDKAPARGRSSGAAFSAKAVL